VRVQQVGGTVQGDDGLSGARSALDDEHAVLWRADDLVLLGLDRGDDVAERAGAPAFECGEQRGVAAQRLGARRSVEAFVVAEAEVPLAEQLVLDTEEFLALDGEVAPPQQTHGVATGGPVEGLGDRCPPVDDDRLAVLVGDGETADVEALDGVGRLGGAVDATEDQRGVAQVEVGEPLEECLVERVALEAGLERSAEIGLVQVPQAPGGFPTDTQTPRMRGRCRPVRQRDRGAAGS
jgi:hypothetical protein